MLTKENQEIIRFFRNIESLSEILAHTGGKDAAGSERRTLYDRQRAGRST